MCVCVCLDSIPMLGLRFFILLCFLFYEFPVYFFVKVNERDRGISTQMLMFILFLFLSAYFYISLFVCMRGLVRRWPLGLQCSSTNTSCQPNGNNGGDDDDDDDIEREQASIRPASSSSEIRVGYWSSLSVGNS